jgi:DNA replication protein DnaC
MALEPTVSHEPDVRRTLAEVNPDLRAPLRQCVCGELPWPLFLFGAAGVGKTCAGLCLLDHAGGGYWKLAVLCQYLIDVGKGLIAWQREGRSGTVSRPGVWKAIAAVPLLVLDEIGSRERVSDHHYETLQEVLDRRRGKPLVSISNLTLEGVARLYDDRIVSRLACGTVVNVVDRDRRIEP